MEMSGDWERSPFRDGVAPGWRVLKARLCATKQNDASPKGGGAALAVSENWAKDTFIGLEKARRDVFQASNEVAP